jgi:ribonuclease E
MGDGGVNEARMPANPLALVSEREPEIDLEVDREEDSLRHTASEPELSVKPEVSLPVTGKVGWLDRAEQRAKPTKLEPVKPVVEPPELVSVEMTPQEQDVYAFMGVSPLVRLNRTVKNSRSVIINVILPGQLPAADTLSENETPNSELPEQLPVSGTLSDQPDSELTNDSSVESDTIILPINAEQEFFPDTSESEPSPISVMNESEAEANSGVSVNRRRRRRSSATENRSED